MRLSSRVIGLAAAAFVWGSSPLACAAADASVPQTSAQLAAEFPDPAEAGMEYALNRRAFKGYKGRGILNLRSRGVRSAEIYINGRLISTQKLFASGKEQVTIPIGSYTQDGENTLKVLKIEPAGAKLEASLPYPELLPGRPEQAGFSEKKLQIIDQVIGENIRQGFPGAVLLVLKNGRVVKETAYGWAKMYDGTRLLPEDKREPMTVDTMFDLASNTKMYATIFALMKLTDEGRINPEDYVVKYLPEYKGDGRENIRLRDVISHSAGYSPYIAFNKPEAGKFYSLQREKTLSLLPDVPLSYPTGTKTVYSDTDYMLLAEVIERVTGQRLDDYVEKNIYQPLGLGHTLFNPLRKGFVPADFAATEPCGNTRSGMVYFPGVRQYTIQGEVQDERAYYSMDGVSGHAGLFSRAGDLAVLAQLMLNQGGYGGYRLCSPQVVTRFTKPTDENPLFGLGWNKMVYPERNWEFGPYAGSDAIAHSGWTGIDIEIDPQHDLAVILLTNRVHAPNIPGDPDRFVTKNFPAARYGSMLSLVYEAFLEENP